ncbi:MAG: CopG family transcriptional regulator [Thermoprotei archaeon]|nr:MAG: CopG family transcriptional regulator [Thermoprotei archaeon]
MSRDTHITVRIPEALLKKIDELVERGFYKSRSEAVRHAIILLLEKHGLLEVK